MIPVTERLPIYNAPDGADLFITYNETNKRWRLLYYEDGKWVDQFDDEWDVTHWCELPSI